MALIVIIVTILVIGFGFVAYIMYRRTLRRAKNIERGLKMVPLLIHLPPPSSDTEAGTRDVREVMREKVAQAEVLYNLIAGTATAGFKSNFYGQRHIALEIIATQGLIHFYAAVPVALVEVVENAIQTAYPGAKIEQAEDHNIFNPQGKLSGTAGGELVLKVESAYPIATIDKLERDPIEALINSLSSLSAGDGVGIQIMMRPAPRSWTKRSLAIVKKKRHTAGHKASATYSSRDVLLAPMKAPEERRQEIASNSPQAVYMTDLEQSVVKAIEDKTTLAAFEVLIRVLVSSSANERTQTMLREVATSFSLFDAPGLNGFKFLPASDIAGLVTAFILRFFPPELNRTILNSQELASLFHLPDSQFTPNAEVERQTSKQVDGPSSLPTTGLLLGYNFFRGTKKEIRLSPEDRRRHSYIVGQTGTGKSTLLENLAVQDMLAGNGFAFIDPHGDTAERLLSMVPKNRAEDIIYFNPADTEHPLGFNLFEFSDPTQKDFLIQEAIGMLYKIYDPQKQGIIGPRFEQWFRNAALTIMSDPAGASFIEIPKVFTDNDYLKQKFQYLQDQTVIEFWTKEMAQTSDYHKSEMLGWFASKFGAFAQNEVMRNIIGQTKSAFNLRDIMDNKKILIVNLSKGMLGELNANLLGMMFVIKFQAAAMSRANVDESLRPDFCLYVDEFQNFSTDSFASILSEARKYHLNLIVANQFIGQLTDEIRDAVFGNVGTIMSYRTGPEDAEFLVKQFAPIFDARDMVNIPNHNAVIRLMIGGLPSQPFSLTALPPLGVENPQLGEAVKQLSAAKFGVNRAQVEQEIYARLAGKPAPASPPAVGPSAPEVTSNPVPAAVAPAVPVPEPAPTPTVASTSPPTVPTLSVSPSPAPVSSPEPAPATPVQPVPSPQPAASSTEPASGAKEPPSTVLPLPKPTPVSSAAPAATPSVPAPSAPVITMPPPPAPSSENGPSPSLPKVVPAQPTPATVPADEAVFHVPIDPTDMLAQYAAKVYPDLQLPDVAKVSESKPAESQPPEPKLSSQSEPKPPQATGPTIIKHADSVAQPTLDRAADLNRSHRSVTPPPPKKEHHKSKPVPEAKQPQPEPKPKTPEMTPKAESPVKPAPPKLEPIASIKPPPEVELEDVTVAAPPRPSTIFMPQPVTPEVELDEDSSSPSSAELTPIIHLHEPSEEPTKGLDEEPKSKPAETSRDQSLSKPEPKAEESKAKPEPALKPSSAPLVAAGEIYVDEDGNVIQG